MKKTTFLFVTIIGAFLFSCKDSNEKKILDNQVSAKGNAAHIQDSIQKAEDLVVEQTRQDSIDQLSIKGYSVEKISGKHKYGGTTKIQYKNLSQLLADEAKEANKQMLSDEEKESRIRSYKFTALGGQIRLDIERITIDAANTDEFSIIIKDLNEKELYRADLNSNIPETPNSNDYWWNIHLQDIDQRIAAPFYVYIVDKLNDTPFKYKITPIKR